jgi:hypothetical protein
MNLYRKSIATAGAGFCLSLILLSGMLFSTAVHAQSLEQIIQQLRQKEQELSDFRRKNIDPLETEIQEERNDFTTTRSAVEIARKGNKEAGKVVGRLKASLRDVQDKQFILSFGTVELAELFKKFDQATTNEEGTRIGRRIFRARFGINSQPPPDFTRLSDVIFSEKIKFRREAVALIGPALVGIGQILVKVVDIRTGVLKPKKDAFGELVGPLFKPVFTHLKIWSTAIGEPVLPQDRLAAEAKRVAKEMTRIRDQNLFGHPDGRDAAQKAAVEARASIETRLAKEEAKLEKITKIVEEMESILDTARAKLDEKEAKLAALRTQESALLVPIQDLRDKSKEAQSREILREATGLRIGLRTSIVSMTDAEGRGRTGGLAVDDLTSALTGLPTRLKATIKSTYMVQETVKCEECRRRGDSDDIVCTPREVQTFKQVTLPSDVDAAVFSNNDAVSTSGRAIDGAQPGRGAVSARLQTGIKDVRTEDSVCGRITVVDRGPPADSAPGNTVEVYKLDNLRLSGVRSDEKSLDLFVVARDTLGRSFKEQGNLGLRADAEGPNAERFARNIRIQPNFSGRKRGLDINQRNPTLTGFFARAGGADVEVSYVVRAVSGSTLQRLKTKVTTSAVGARSSGEELEMQDTGRFAVVIDGKADTSKLTVTWAANGVHMAAVGLEETTKFSGKTSNNDVSFDDIALAGAVLRVRAEVREGEKLVASIEFPEMRLIAKLSDMRFVLAGSNIRVAALDIFTPAPANALPGIQLQVLDANRAPIEFSSFAQIRPDVRQEGLEILRIGQSTEMTRTIDGRAIAGTTEVGAGNLIAELDIRAARQAGVTFIREAQSTSRLVDNVLVTLNRLVIERQEGQQGQEFVLKSAGPARMTGYRAVFTFGDGSTQTTGFESSQFGGEARVPVNGRRFVRGDVTRQSGTIVGTVRADLDGAPLPPPIVTIDIPPEGRSGSSLVVRGQIQNIKHNDSFDLRCEWEVDPAFGTFKDAVTPVSPTGESGGICINNLTLSDDPANLNRDVGVNIKVSRQVGAGGRS